MAVAHPQAPRVTIRGEVESGPGASVVVMSLAPMTILVGQHFDPAPGSGQQVLAATRQVEVRAHVPTIIPVMCVDVTAHAPPAGSVTYTVGLGPEEGIRLRILQVDQVRLEERYGLPAGAGRLLVQRALWGQQLAGAQPANARESLKEANWRRARLLRAHPGREGLIVSWFDVARYLQVPF